MYLHDGPAYGHYQIMLDFVPFKDLTKLAVVNICLFIIIIFFFFAKGVGLHYLARTTALFANLIRFHDI